MMPNTGGFAQNSNTSPARPVCQWIKSNLAKHIQFAATDHVLNRTWWQPASEGLALSDFKAPAKQAGAFSYLVPYRATLLGYLHSAAHRQTTRATHAK